MPPERRTLTPHGRGGPRPYQPRGSGEQTGVERPPAGRGQGSRRRSGPSRAGIVALAVVLLALVALVAIRLATGGSSALARQDSHPVPPAVLAAITGIPAATYDAVGAGGVTARPLAVSGPALTAGGKPELLYVGAEYCPFCAATRWSLVAALSRFGQVSGLELMTSSASDSYPSSPTFTFVHATFSSPYLALVTVELTTNQLQGGHYAPLQQLTPAQQATVDQFDAPPYVAADAKGTIPFLDLANRELLSGAPFSPALLQGKDWRAIAADLAQPTSPDARAIIGGANVLSAAICAVDGNQPGAVCNSGGVRQVGLAAS